MPYTTKKQLALDYGLNRSQLSVYMNVVFFEELKSVGYSKHMRILPPKVVAKFYELFGEPD